VADLIVVGGSLGGLVAAIMVADQGGRVVTVERQKEPGGGAAREPEHVAVAGSPHQAAAGIDDSPAGLVADLVAETRHHVDPALAMAIAEQGAPALEWLASRCGLEATLVPGSAYRGHSAARIHSLGARGGGVLVEALRAIVGRHHRVRVFPGVTVARLTQDEGGRVSGVELESKRRSDPAAVEGAVALACGGYAADDELIARVAPDLAAFPARACPTSTGDGLRLAEGTGARVEEIAACAVTPFLTMPGDLTVDPALVSHGAILVNQAGRRFVDETADPLVVAGAINQQPGRVAYLLFDERAAQRTGAHSPHFATTVLPHSVRRAGSVAHMANQLELDPEGLALTLDTFNANLDLGGDPFGREGDAHPLAAPLQAMRVTPSRRRSLGGLAIDRDARVLGQGGDPIGNLYAVGGVVGGLGRGGPADELPGMAPLITLATARLAALAWQAARPADD
jgi:fumarate reductase flavoprotein subunit